ncbi:glycine--tRNA ligase subunit beta [Campylobacter geochelonis]|uniref:glycine--tRNA ligase subunit beta n=1 Tax=Campylobacter geochelonis TaxID=1780362 RepID=UPI0007707A60|nr:glycine--tRNA ligase subunit beta [Campylobacter geochelonis]CZE48307.1 glycyl-tRNA synthetase subunit beta [Campylobacter geochelonis]CZE50071.1 glycyl-tRNA synthetase subunit beta [Campylobacter geochelonis]
MGLLIEIGVEELPAIPFLKEYKNIAPKWKNVLDKFGFDDEFRFEFTPRRLVLIHDNFASRQKDQVIEKIGAPKQVALKDGIWSKAALSFADKVGISVDELSFKEIDGKEVLYHKSVQKGERSQDVFKDMIDEFLRSLSFGKSMRWGANSFEFIRPIRSLACVFNGENIDMNLFGVSSKMGFYPHRNFGYELVEFKNEAEYFDKLAKNGVILDKNKREEKILAEFLQIEAKSGFKIEIDRELLDEVVAITEHPTALLGEFDKEFLEVPKEVIITSMRENQRYFPVFENGELSNHFVVVSNAITDDNELIIKGNQKVLRARLSDAMFFWQSDLKAEFSPNKLKNIVYMKELGSVYDKSVREREIVRKFANIYAHELKLEFDGDVESELDRAVMLSKADLTTSMVGEFGELQGVIGGYYAKERNEHPLVVRAISQQYLPTGENSELPEGIFASLVAMSAKLDTLMALFSIGKIPTGNKDPYALRRAANGLIKIVLEQDINFDLRAILQGLASGYAKFELSKLEEFILDRLNTIYDVNASIINACLKSGESDIKRLNSAILALDEISKEDDFRDKFSTFKRLANIIKDEKIGEVDESFFQLDAEKELNLAYKALNLDVKDYKEYLNQLFGLKYKIDKFFDDVMINVDDKSVKLNRIALIGAIYKAFLKVADIKEISL